MAPKHSSLVDAVWSPANSVRENANAQVVAPPMHQAAISPSHRRAHRESLDDLGMQFISLLASRVTLKQTASQFPHIVNKIARHRANPQALVKAIDGLLIDDRPTREGFPFVVLEELLALKEYFETPPAKFRKT